MISLGEHYMETVILLREALFINGILTNAEIWYSLTTEELKSLDDLDAHRIYLYNKKVLTMLMGSQSAIRFMWEEVTKPALY